MLEIIFIILIIMSAIVLHEYAHGWVAFKLGDPTAKLAGRLTLNPLKHMDPFGSVILPGTLMIMRNMGVPVFPIGWAKPVPVNFLRLRNPKQSMIWVGLAGPAINIILAVIFSQVFRYHSESQHGYVLMLAVFINLLLAVFNMVPVPPLDGSRLVMGLLPNHLARSYSRLEPFGILIVFILLFFGLFDKVVLPVILLIGNFLGVPF